MEKFGTNFEQVQVKPEWQNAARALARAEIALEKTATKDIADEHTFVDFKVALQQAIRMCEGSKDGTMNDLGKQLVGFRNRMFVKKEFTDFASLKEAYAESSSFADIDDITKAEAEKIREREAIAA
ncbi:MAG: hypothetical protein KGH93_01245 [Patescibacteria group bacterium]|nr:hypothetical protein [Patescibacteria group bacterium]MDE1945807.1 hypothetical protein [Patescibacteria group bacterium]